MGRKTYIVGAVVCFFLLAAAQCTTNQLPAHNAKPVIDFNGDSITYLATAAINAHYGATSDVGINATVGMTTKEQAFTVKKQALDVPAVEVINLGTNDARDSANGSGETVDQANAELDLFNSEFPHSCVVFVTVDSHNPSWGPTFAAAVDAHIRATFSHVADWDSALVPFGPGGDFIKADDPHPTNAGNQHLLSVEDAAIATCTPVS